jgi:hypothetical protein
VTNELLDDAKFKRGDRVSVKVADRPEKIGTVVTSTRPTNLRAGCERVLIDGTKQPWTYHRDFLTRLPA